LAATFRSKRLGLARISAFLQVLEPTKVKHLVEKLKMDLAGHFRQNQMVLD
jgi:hypothetical protein